MEILKVLINSRYQVGWNPLVEVHGLPRTQKKLQGHNGVKPLKPMILRKDRGNESADGGAREAERQGPTTG